MNLTITTEQARTLAGCFRTISSILETSCNAGQMALDFSQGLEPVQVSTPDPEPVQTAGRGPIVNHNPGYSRVSNIAHHFHISTKGARVILTGAGIDIITREDGREYITHADVERANRAIMSAIKWNKKPFRIKK